MKIKAIYKKNLKMPEGKVASQIAHAVKNLGETPADCDIIVLKVSDKKFNELTEEHKNCYIQVDKGLTVVESGTATAAAWIESQGTLYGSDIVKLRPEFQLGGYMTMIDWFTIDDIGDFYGIRSGLKHADGVTKSPFHYDYYEHGDTSEKNVLAHFNEWWNNLEINK
jgi:hypothetical protein